MSLAIALAMDRAIIRRELTARDIIRALYLLKYAYLFALYELKSHAKMVRIILSRRPAINPQIVKLYVQPRSDYGIAILASSITNTPGTVTVHVDKARGLVYIHWIEATSNDPSVVEREVVAGLNELAAKIFG